MDKEKLKKVWTMLLKDSDVEDQKELATRTGISESTISRILTGKRENPTIKQLQKIAIGLGMKLDDLTRILNDPDSYLREYGSDLRSEKQKYFDHYLAKWLKNSDCVYSAPACTFLSGEHAVVFGHPAIYLPLPLRLYIKVEASPKIAELFIGEFKCPHPKEEMRILKTDSIADYGSCTIEGQKESLDALFRLIIKPFLKIKFHQIGFRINVLSSFPIAVGLDSSGALSACIAKAFVDNFLDMERFKIYFELADQENKEVAMLLAWAIENCFHGGCSSGAGATVSFNGRAGRHPIVYSIAKRSRLFHRHLEGWNSVSISASEEGFRLLSEIKRFIFDPGERIKNLRDYQNPPSYNITILYSGVPSRTADVLNRSVRSYLSEDSKRVAHICEMFDRHFKPDEIQRSLLVHRHDIIEKIYLNPQLDEEKSEQMALAYFELLSEALGSISIATFNSIVSDWSSVPSFMNSYQALLCGMGLSHPAIESFIDRLKSKSLETREYQAELVSSLGVKLTGAGKGGDILVLSLFDKEMHANLIKQTIQDSHVIHFDSCELSDKQWKSSVDGVRRESLR